jgi:hypothetical protein
MISGSREYRELNERMNGECSKKPTLIEVFNVNKTLLLNSTEYETSPAFIRVKVLVVT